MSWLPRKRMREEDDDFYAHPALTKRNAYYGEWGTRNRVPNNFGMDDVQQAPMTIPHVFRRTVKRDLEAGRGSMYANPSDRDGSFADNFSEDDGADGDGRFVLTTFFGGRTQRLEGTCKKTAPQFTDYDRSAAGPSQTPRSTVRTPAPFSGELMNSRNLTLDDIASTSVPVPDIAQGDRVGETCIGRNNRDVPAVSVDEVVRAASYENGDTGNAFMTAAASFDTRGGVDMKELQNSMQQCNLPPEFKDIFLASTAMVWSAMSNMRLEMEELQATFEKHKQDTSRKMETQSRVVRQLARQASEGQYSVFTRFNVNRLWGTPPVIIRFDKTSPEVNLIGEAAQFAVCGASSTTKRAASLLGFLLRRAVPDDKLRHLTHADRGGRVKHESLPVHVRLALRDVFRRTFGITKNDLDEVIMTAPAPPEDEWLSYAAQVDSFFNEKLENIITNARRRAVDGDNRQSSASNEDRNRSARS